MPLEIDHLNEQQRAAVYCVDGPLLVLAGAGSGKTRVLTYRIAHLIEDLGVSPYQIMAITFTNKAANEMRERLARTLSGGMRGMLVATFHSMCVRFLRQDAPLVGYTRNFSIYDETDSKRLFKEIFSEMNIDTKRFPLNGVRQKISKAKNELIDAEEYASRATNAYETLTAQVYLRLQERLRATDAMDFDDLLFNTFLLLSGNPEVLDAYQRRFLYIHIDEYQDTNAAQYAIAHLLAAQHHNIMVVGDDDQSIYSWRGADIRNILGFEEDYPRTTVVKLEQNYRSTQTILEAANAVISVNTSRKPKRLFTQGDKGEPIGLYVASDERDEGRWIASEIERLVVQGRRYRDCALFYRTNAQSRVLEDMLLRAGVPYKIVGGTRFFDRAEIRDVMAYLRVVANPLDEMALKRIVNVPKRGIGKTRLEQLEFFALERQVGFFEALELALEEGLLPKQAHEGLAGFVRLIHEAQLYRGGLREIVEMIVTRSGLIDHVQGEHKEDALSRIENIKEFFGVAQEFEENHNAFDDVLMGFLQEGVAGKDEAGAGGAEVVESAEGAEGGEGVMPAEPTAAEALMAFCEWLALRSDLDSLVAGEDYLTLMTIHSAKGLEFDVVFIAGMEESLFPHINSVREKAGLEEERRLAYVAITRARELLYMCHAQVRKLFGGVQANQASRFIKEIPEECLVLKGIGSRDFGGLGWEKRGDRHGIFGSGNLREGGGRSGGFGGGSGGGSGSTGSAFGGNESALKKRRDVLVLKVGDKVDHKTFGEGVVTAVEGDALSVLFTKSGLTKKLLMGYAPLVLIDK